MGTDDWPDGADHRPALPPRLSPSRAKQYKQCPRLFYFTTVAGLSSPPTLATAKGTIVHAACEHIFDLPPQQRTVETAVTYLAPAWADLTADVPDDPDKAADAATLRELAPAGSEQEAKLLADAEQAVTNWFAMERVGVIDPTAVVLPDGATVDGRELHLQADVGPVTVHGFVDRFDTWVADDVRRWSITDYKTGRVPAPRYVDEYWFQLRVYALLAFLQWGVIVDMVRLVFVTNGRPDDILRLTVDEALLRRTAAELTGLWRAITAAARTGTWPTRTGPLCGWCHFQPVCPAFAGQNPTPAD